MQESCCAKKQKVSETIDEAFKLAEKLLLVGRSADTADGRDKQARRCCKLEKELHAVREGVEESSTKVKKLKKLEKEVKSICDKALKTF